MRFSRTTAAAVLAAVLLVVAPGMALAQEPEPPPEPAPPPPTDVDCYPLSIFCTTPVTVGPFVFNFPNGIFGPPATSP